MTLAINEAPLLVLRARPYLERLGGRFDETVNLGILSGDNIVYLDIIESPKTVRLAARVSDHGSQFTRPHGEGLAADLQQGRGRSCSANRDCPDEPRTPLHARPTSLSIWNWFGAMDSRSMIRKTISRGVAWLWRFPHNVFTTPLASEAIRRDSPRVGGGRRRRASDTKLVSELSEQRRCRQSNPMRHVGSTAALNAIGLGAARRGVGGCHRKGQGGLPASPPPMGRIGATNQQGKPKRRIHCIPPIQALKGCRISSTVDFRVH